MKTFLSRNKYALLVPVLVIAFFALLLIFLSSGPQAGAFKYQLH